MFNPTSWSLATLREVIIVIYGIGTDKTVIVWWKQGVLINSLQAGNTPNDPQMAMIMTQSLRRFDLVNFLQGHSVYNLSDTRRDRSHRNGFSLLNEI